MRLTREVLLKFARDSAAQRARVSRRIVCIYLTGSVLLSDAPLLGGTTDIDLVIIHDSEPVYPREIVRVTEDVHLDIGHYAQSVFRQPRHLRADPWLGPFIYNKPLVLHDTQHWFDFTQASTGAQFFQPETVLQRATTLVQSARQGWMELENDPRAALPRRVYGTLRVLENAGNALASLNGAPLPERRFMLLLGQRLQSLNMPDLAVEFNHLLVPDYAPLAEHWPAWSRSLSAALQAAGSQPECPPRLHPARHSYYERAAAVLWDDNPSAALWILLRIWTLAVCGLPEESDGLAEWRNAMQILQMDEKRLPARLVALDRYLDRVEEALEAWGRANGVGIDTNM